METAVPGQIKHAFRQNGLSEIRTELQVVGDIGSTGTVWSQNEACLTGIQAYTKAEVNTALNLKVNALNPAFSGTATGLSKAMVQLGNVDNTTDALKVVSDKTQTALNLKANTIDVYTKTQVANFFHPKIDSFVSPLKCDLNILSGINALSIDSTAHLSIGDITCSGTLNIDSIAPRVDTEITIAGNFVVNDALIVDLIRSSLSDHVQVDNNLSVAGNLFATEFGC